MIADLRQDQFTHCKCQNCKHFGKIKSFSPKVVNLKDSNHPYIKFTLDESSNSVLQTINFNCPICNSADVEVMFTNEVN